MALVNDDSIADRARKLESLRMTNVSSRLTRHETDHLDGKLFIDYLSPLKRRAALAKWEKEKDGYPGNIRKVRTEVKGEHHHETEM